MRGTKKKKIKCRDEQQSHESFPSLLCCLFLYFTLFMFELACVRVCVCVKVLAQAIIW